jgi:hypothetical protein
MLLDYISAATRASVYEKMDDGTYCGTICHDDPLPCATAPGMAT